LADIQNIFDKLFITLSLEGDVFAHIMPWV